jgi:hypothetical protein
LGLAADACSYCGKIADAEAATRQAVLSLALSLRNFADNSIRIAVSYDLAG